MPTERFSRLQETKQKRISEAIITEFQRTTYGELQISNIARNARISRASLYTYFPDKEDLFQFALEQMQKQNLESPKKKLLLNQLQEQVSESVLTGKMCENKNSANQKGEPHE
ncbi:MAG: TetR/AcrR family transcriptional regulator [Lachnospiraceae bacterium]|nr:TetR/AcrR family transcriptional regulator [Lachnospiraceae bacterium]